MKIKNLLKEAFHTYQSYLMCINLAGDSAKIPLLKWPDVAQSAIEYAIAWENKNPMEIRETEEIRISREILIQDLGIIIVAPLEGINQSLKERLTQILNKEPQTPKLDSNKYINPIETKKILLESINNMFKTLETMTGYRYPVLSEYKDNL